MVAKSKQQTDRQNGSTDLKDAQKSSGKKQHAAVEDAETPESKLAKYDDLFNVDKFDSIMTEVEKDFEHAQKMLAALDKEAAAKIRLMENEFFSKKKEHFELRSKVLHDKHQNFWPLIFLHHPSIELFLNLAAKENDIQQFDLATCQAIRGVEINIQNTDDKYCTKLTLHFNPDNDLFENASVSRTIKFTDSGDENVDPMSNAQVETTTLKPKAKLKAIIGKLSKSSTNDKDNSKKSVEDLIAEAEMDSSKIPFIVQFADEKCKLMNDFVESMKPIYNNPVSDIKNALMNEDLDEDFDMDDDDSEEEELDSIEEDPEEEN